MPIQEHLAEIQANRAEQRRALEQRESEFKNIKDFAFKLEKLSHNPVWMAMINEAPARKKAWDSLWAYIQETDFFNKVRTLFGSNANAFERGGALKDIWERINREYITISVMGPISAGKSLLLQLITGLGDNVIPVSANTCTAACTTFINDPRKEATIEFLSEGEVKDILVEHIELLNAHLKNTNQTNSLTGIITKDTASNISLSTLMSKVQSYGYLSDNLYSEHAIAIGTESTLGTSFGYYKTVKAYCDNYHSGYSQYIGRTQNMSLNENEILSGELKRYVSYDANGSSVAFAVRKVTIYWPLNLGEENLGQIRLKDTMGVGEAKIGVTKDLVKALRDESDIAVALCCVKELQTLDTDVNTRTFVQVVKDSVEGRKPEQWIYYLLNKYANASVEDVNRVKGQLIAALAKGNVHIDLPEKNFSAVEFLLQNGENNYAGIANYFSSVILPNIVQNISIIDNFFVAKAQETLSDVLAAFKVIAGMFASFPIPSCNIEHYIKDVLREVQNAYFKLVDIRASYEDEIQAALISHLKDYPLGSFVAMSLGHNEIRSQIVAEKKKLQPHELKEKEVSIAEKFVLSSLKEKYNDNHYRSGYAFTYFTEVFRDLEDSMGDDIEGVIGQTEVVNKVADIKEKIGELFITKGKISLNNVTAKGWLKAFVNELKKNEGDYPHLISCLEAFIEEDIDLKKNVIDTVRHIIHKVVSGYHNFGDLNVIEDYGSWVRAMALCLVHKENRFSGIVRTEYSEQIGKEIRIAQEKFITSTNEFMVGPDGLLPNSTTLATPLVFTELLKYYVDNYKTIFGEDEYAKKQNAIAEATTIRETYCK